MKLYCYAEGGSDPHEIVLELSESDVALIDQVREREGKLSGHELGRFVTVTDMATLERWQVASAPCGLSCHCGSEARPVTS